MFQKKRERKISGKRVANSKINLNKLVISFVLAVVLFFILTGIEAGYLKNYEKISLVIAKADVKAGTEITTENLDSLFFVGEVAANQCIEHPVTDINVLKDTIITRDMIKNEAISKNYLQTKDYYLADIVNPIEISVKADNLSQVVGGIIRKGDRIDILAYNEETKICDALLTDVYVQNVFDNTGKEIDLYSKDPATVLNIMIEREHQIQVNERLQKSKIYISKIY